MATESTLLYNMMHRDLSYCEGIMAKTRREYKLHENKEESHTNPLHTFRKWSITWSHYLVILRVG